MLEIKDLTVKASDKEILNNLNLTINDGEIHVLMGPNGTGKSTICKVLMHHPDYEVMSGSIKYNEQEITNMPTNEISKLGFFLLSQNPIEIEGITNAELIRTALGEKTGEKVDIFKFNKRLNEVCEIINLPKNFVHRDVNFNMSGGERKKNELLHLFMLEPKFIILDEIDSGLDVDALKTVGVSLRKYYEMFKPSILIVTHHADILKYFDDYTVSVLKDGKIIKSGPKSLVTEIETLGFEANVINGTDKNE
ncbi:MAG: Fe-S cluster assembly ATPase SufC [Ruminococcus sp.]|nr:Fe-S cluster assembly ATPase SufC [Ruminococcus sp.]